MSEIYLYIPANDVYTDCCFAPVAFFGFLAFHKERTKNMRNPNHATSQRWPYFQCPWQQKFFCHAVQSLQSKAQHFTDCCPSSSQKRLNCYDYDANSKRSRALAEPISHFSTCPCPDVVRGFAPEAAKKHWFLSVQCK
jgi:hypothetical protein